MKLSAAPALLAKCFACLAVASLTISGAGAQSKLERILKDKKMVLGYMDGGKPFGYTDEKGNVLGWSVDLSKAIHKTIEKKFNTPIDLQLALVTPQTRIPPVSNGTVDFVLASTGITLERMDAVDFSMIHNAVCVNMLHRKKLALRSYADLRGRRVGVPGGGVEEKVLTDMGKNGKINPPPKMTAYTSMANAFLALDQGKVDVYVTSAPALISARQNAKNPDDWVVDGPDLFCISNGIILPQNDSKWTTTVNKALCYLITTGEFQNIYDDWFKGKFRHRRAFAQGNAR